MRSLVALLIAITVAAGASAHAAAAPADTDRTSIEVSPISPFIRIYALQIGYEVAPGHELLTGPVYMNIHYDVGYTRAFTMILGYRYYVWRTLHLEYQLWPIYDWFRETDEQKTYPSFDLWNEARIGYRIDFEAGGHSFFVNPQLAFGFGLYASNKPESFQAIVEEEPYFYAPQVFVGARF